MWPEAVPSSGVIELERHSLLVSPPLEEALGAVVMLVLSQVCLRN